MAFRTSDHSDQLPFGLVVLRANGPSENKDVTCQGPRPLRIVFFKRVCIRPGRMSKMGCIPRVRHLKTALQPRYTCTLANFVLSIPQLLCFHWLYSLNCNISSARVRRLHPWRFKSNHSPKLDKLRNSQRDTTTRRIAHNAAFPTLFFEWAMYPAGVAVYKSRNDDDIRHL